MGARASAIFDADDARMLAAIKRIDKQLLNLQGNFAKFSNVASGALAILGVGEAVAKGIEGVKSALELGSQVSMLSQQTGIAVGELMRIRKEFKNMGKDASDIGPVMAKMLKSIGTGAAAATLNEMGLSLEQLRKMSTADQFYAIGKAIASLQNPSMRTAAAMDIFGKSGATLLPMFSAHGFGQGAKELNLQAQLMQQDAALFHETTNELRMAGEKMNGFYLGIADHVAPILLQTLEAMNAKNATGIGSDIGEALAAMMESLADGSIIGVFSLQLLDAITSAINYITGSLNGLFQGLGNGMLQAGENFIALLLDGVAKVLDYMAKAPGLGGLSSTAANARTSADSMRGSIVGAMGAGWADGQTRDQMPWTNALRMATLDAMGEEYGKANKRQQEALAGAPTIPPGTGDGILGIVQANVSALARIGGNYGGGGGGDPLLDENRRQTGLLQQLVNNTSRLSQGGAVGAMTPVYQ